MKKKITHIEESPLTYTKNHLSKPKLILTVFLVVVVTASLVVGGTVSYFTMQNEHFITVDGREVITPEVLETIQSQILSSSLSDQQKMGQVMQYLGPIQQSYMWIAYADNNGISFQSSDIFNALKKTYNETKERYQKEYNTYFNMSYNDFVQRNTDTFNVQSIFAAISFPIPLDSFNKDIEYTADHTTSTVAYKYINLLDFVISTNITELGEYYTKNKKKQIIGSKDMKVLEFASIDEANARSKDLQKDINGAKKKFEKSKNNLTISNTEKESYIFIQDIKKDNITPAFTYKGKNYVGLVIAENPLEFNKLKQDDLKEVAQGFYDSLNKTQQSAIKNKINENLKNNGIKSPFLHTGTTTPIGISKNQDAKDSKTSEPLSFASTSNQEFFLNAFHPVGFTSEPLSYMDNFYIITVKELNMAKFPISPTAEAVLDKTLSDRENNLWLMMHNSVMQKDIKMDINIKNISQLLSKKG